MVENPTNIPKKAQLIEGIGASSWFAIKKEKELYRIERFSLEGRLECSRLFKAQPNSFDVNSKYEFTYLSHCKECTIMQNDKMFKFYNK